MDYSKVTFAEYQAKKKAILNSLGRADNCKVSEISEIENPLETIKIVMDYELPYEIPVDWSKVEVNTPILVKDDKRDEWVKRHFAKYENSLVWAFNNGFTSWAGKQGNVNSWNYAKLAENEETK